MIQNPPKRRLGIVFLVVSIAHHCVAWLTWLIAVYMGFSGVGGSALADAILRVWTFPLAGEPAPDLLLWVANSTLWGAFGTLIFCIAKWISRPFRIPVLKADPRIEGADTDTAEPEN